MYGRLHLGSVQPGVNVQRLFEHFMLLVVTVAGVHGQVDGQSVAHDVVRHRQALSRLQEAIGVRAALEKSAQFARKPELDQNSLARAQVLSNASLAAAMYRI